MTRLKSVPIPSPQYLEFISPESLRSPSIFFFLVLFSKKYEFF